MPTLKNRPHFEGCKWIDSPIIGREEETPSVADWFGFEAPRFFWLTNLTAGQWRGRHAHRETSLATFAVTGSCRLTLDDGRQKKVVDLEENGPGLLIGPWIWHDLYDFSPKTVILVIASTRYSEPDYIRDYERFVSEAAERLRQST